MYPSRFKLVAICLVLLTVSFKSGDAFNLMDMLNAMFGEGGIYARAPEVKSNHIKVPEGKSHWIDHDVERHEPKTHWMDYDSRHAHSDEHDSLEYEDDDVARKFFVTFNNIFVFPSDKTAENHQNHKTTENHQNHETTENHQNHETTENHQNHETEEAPFDYSICVNPANWKTCAQYITGIGLDSTKPKKTHSEPTSDIKREDLLSVLRGYRNRSRVDSKKKHFRASSDLSIPKNAGSNVTVALRNNNIAEKKFKIDEIPYRKGLDTIVLGDDKVIISPTIDNSSYRAQNNSPQNDTDDNTLRSSSGSNVTLNTQKDTENTSPLPQRKRK